MIDAEESSIILYMATVMQSILRSVNQNKRKNKEEILKEVFVGNYDLIVAAAKNIGEGRDKIILDNLIAKLEQTVDASSN